MDYCLADGGEGVFAVDFLGGEDVGDVDLVFDVSVVVVFTIIVIVIIIICYCMIMKNLKPCKEYDIDQIIMYELKKKVGA